MPGKGPVRTGVTAILPHDGNIFKEKVPAAAFVFNGFGKSTGFHQINEVGNLETPILLTNTLNAVSYTHLCEGIAFGRRNRHD